MKTLQTILLTAVMTLMTTVAFAQETNGTSEETIGSWTIATSEEGLNTVVFSEWFTGAVPTTDTTKSTTIMLNKRDHYMQSGFSSKTLLIRGLLKKAAQRTEALV